MAPAVAEKETAERAEPTGKVAKFIEGLRTEAERRYATNEWRRLAGYRKTRATPFDLTPARAKNIREALAEIVA